ncbi:FAD-dependent oxidoreductase [Naumannella sp. ID2617S]|nr:FAD-dependent oxidoreductase [Naumannella sp. ID2617S]
MVEQGWSVAVVGSGPSGLYAVQALLKQERVARIDVFESLPAPYGLLRYGVAPDHAKTKTISRALARAFDDDRVRFFGNVHVGRTVTREELLEHYDAIVYATGARYDRELGIPGEDLTGSVGAADFVAWYSGHPDVPQPADLTGNQSAVVIGAGNVALDVARICLQDRRILENTDMPRSVVEEIASAPLSEVHLLIRRGPEHVKFSRVELDELLTLPDLAVELHVDPAELAERTDLPREATINLKLFREALARGAEERAAGQESPTRSLHVHFWTTPIRIEGTDHVTGVEVVTRPPDGTVTEARIPTQAAIRAIGYRGEPVPGLPFDEAACLIPNEAGAVSAPAAEGREFVTGWIKRGPTGVIGTNRGDASETVQTLVERLGRTPQAESRGDIAELLAERGATTVDWSEWNLIEEAEKALGSEHGAHTVKLAQRDELLQAAGKLVSESEA